MRRGSESHWNSQKKIPSLNRRKRDSNLGPSVLQSSILPTALSSSPSTSKKRALHFFGITSWVPGVAWDSRKGEGGAEKINDQWLLWRHQYRYVCVSKIFLYLSVCLPPSPLSFSLSPFLSHLYSPSSLFISLSCFPFFFLLQSSHHGSHAYFGTTGNPQYYKVQSKSFTGSKLVNGVKNMLDHQFTGKPHQTWIYLLRPF